MAPRSGEAADGKLPAGGKCGKGQLLALLLKGRAKGGCKGHLFGKGGKGPCPQETKAACDPELAPTLGAESGFDAEYEMVPPSGQQGAESVGNGTGEALIDTGVCQLAPTLGA